MSMPAIRLDFVRRRPAWPAWLLFAVAGLIALDVGRDYIRLRGDLDAAEHRASSKLARRPNGGDAASAAPLERELAAAKRVLVELTLPWDALFRSLESSAGPDVALLAIEPDASRATLRISGEARDYPAVLAFIDRLGKAGGLSRVHLLGHEIRDVGPQRSCAFTLTANWGADR